MARPARGRERLLDAAEDLLLARGYGATQLERVCERAGVSKGALFYHFDSKEALAQATLERFFQRLVTGAHDALAASGAATATATLFAYLDALAALTRTAALARGCLLGLVSAECPQTYPPLAAAAAQGFRTWHESLTTLIQQAAAEQRVEVDPPGLASALLAAVEGGLLLDRHPNTPPAVEAALAHFRHYLSLTLETGKETRP